MHPPARVYDKDYRLVAEFVFAGENDTSLINDVYVTKTAAYFTDSYQEKIFKVKGACLANECVLLHKRAAMLGQVEFLTSRRDPPLRKCSIPSGATAVSCDLRY